MASDRSLIIIPSISCVHGKSLPEAMHRAVNAKMERLWVCGINRSNKKNSLVNATLISEEPITPMFMKWIEYWSEVKWKNNTIPQKNFIAKDDTYKCLIANLNEIPPSDLRTLLPCSEQTNTDIMFFCYTQIEHDLITRLDEPLLENSLLYYHNKIEQSCFMNTKQGARFLFKKLSLPIIRGSNRVCFFYEELIEETKTLFQQGVKKVIWKPNEGFAGLGQNIVLPTNYKQKPTNPLFSTFLQQGGYICEEWLELPNLISPSAQGWIDQDGKIRLDCIQRQHIKDASCHTGSDLHLPRASLESIAQQMQIILTDLSQQGIRGPVGVDFLAAINYPTVFPVDINIRHGGGTIASIFMHSLIGPFSIEKGCYTDKDTNEDRYFLYYDSCHWEDLYSMHQNTPYPEPDVFMQFLETHCVDLLFNSDKKKGLLLTHLGALASNGICGLAFIDSDYEAISAMEKKLKQTFQQHWRNEC